MFSISGTPLYAAKRYAALPLDVQVAPLDYLERALSHSDTSGTFSLLTTD